MKYLSFLVFFCTSFFSLFFFPAHNAQAAHAKKEDRTDIEKVAVRKSFETEFWKAEFNPYTSFPDQWWLKEYLEEPSQADASLKPINLLEA